jgi:hypothetical protein
MVQVPNYHIFHPKGFPADVLCSSLLTPIKGPQIFLSTIVDDFFSYTLDLNTITFDIRMRGEISKKKVERFAREQQEMKRL